MNKHIVIINGSAGVGKDTFVEQVRYCYLSKGFPHYPAVANYSSVDWIKEIARTMGWLGDKSEKSRKFLSDLKDVSTEYNDMPFKKMQERVEKFKNDSRLKILFLHIREPEEIKKAVIAFDNVATLLITNDRVKHVTSNQADAGVYDYDYDCVINNNGTIEELKLLAEAFIEQLEKSEE